MNLANKLFISIASYCPFIRQFKFRTDRFPFIGVIPPEYSSEYDLEVNNLLSC